MTDLPPNVKISSHPCLRAKLSQLRSNKANARETKALVHEIALILGIEALATLDVTSTGTDETPIGEEYITETISPSSITVVPILRSGLGMLEALETILPFPVSVHHLGLFRDKMSLQPVEYYNNLPQPRRGEKAAASLAILVDPVIATGGTAAAAIQTLKEWGVDRIILISILAAFPGIRKAAEEWPEGTEIFVGGLDPGLTNKGMINPGLGDIGELLFSQTEAYWVCIGDRLFLTIGK